MGGMGGFNKKQMKKISEKKVLMIKSLEKTLGIVTTAAKMAGIDRTTHYNWILTDNEYKCKVESIYDLAIDFVEGKLYDKIKDGDTTAIIFYLKTKGKKRGYVERSELGLTTQNISSLKLPRYLQKSTDSTPKKT